MDLELEMLSKISFSWVNGILVIVLEDIINVNSEIKAIS